MTALIHLPDNLPNLARAKLPATYEAAKASLAECSRIDECAEWRDRAEALASYAKQAGDDSLRKMCDRIQGRAIRRCGEIPKQIPRPDQGGRPSKNGGLGPPFLTVRPPRMRRVPDQKHDALRVASIPGAEFEAAIESDDPFTVTALAGAGEEIVADPRHR